MENATGAKLPKYPRVFWIANSVELLERAAFYGLWIAISLYLTDVSGFNDVDAGWIGGIAGALIYFLPPFNGALADKIGFRKAIILAFTCLGLGYFTLGLAASMPSEFIFAGIDLMPNKLMVFPGLAFVVFGGAFIKSVITGTVAKCSTEENRARAFAIFYFIVNIGAFLGKTFAYPLRRFMGLEYVAYFSALMCFIAVGIVFFYFKGISNDGEGKSIKEVWAGFIRIIKNVRLTVLILIVSGFWMIWAQLYSTMPKYVIRMVGEAAAPEWIANVNPAAVMIFVLMVTSLMAKTKAITSMTFGMFIMPFSALTMAASPLLEKAFGTSVNLGIISLHPILIMMILGIALQGLAECFISPRFLEYFSKQAPKGEEGLYLGFSHLHSFLSHLFAFGISGYLLQAFCPDPKTLTHLTEVERAARYANAHYIWYIFAAIGLISGIALVVYNIITKKIDDKRALQESAAV